MESLNSNDLSNVASELAEGPSSPVLSNNKINRRIINKKLKNGRSKSKLGEKLLCDKHIALSPINNFSTSRLKAVELLESERNKYCDMLWKTVPDAAAHYQPNQIYKRTVSVIRENVEATPCKINYSEIEKHHKESPSVQTASGKQIEITENVINKHSHIFDDILNEKEVSNLVVLKRPINAKMVSKIPVLNRSTKLKENSASPKSVMQSVYLEKTIQPHSQIDELSSNGVETNPFCVPSTGRAVRGTLQVENPTAATECCVNTVRNTTEKKENQPKGFAFKFSPSKSTVDTLDKLYSNQKFGEFSSSTTSLSNYIYSCSLEAFDSEISTELSQMHPSAVEAGATDLRNLNNNVNGICTNDSVELLAMDIDNLSDAFQDQETIALSNSFNAQFTNNKDNDSHAIATTESKSKETKNDCEINLEQITRNEEVAMCIVNENECVQNGESVTLDDAFGISHISASNSNKEKTFDDQQVSICSSKSLINVNIPTVSLPQKNLIELHRNKNFTGYSEDSTSNLDYKVSQCSIKVKKRTLKAHRKVINGDLVGFNRNEQKVSNDETILFINNIKEIEKEIHNTELIIQSKSRDEKRSRDKGIKKHNLEGATEKGKNDACLLKSCKLEKKRKEKSKQSKLKAVAEENFENAVEKIVANEEVNMAIVDDHASQKYKDYKKRKAITAEKEIAEHNKNHVIELNPNQKKFKIEIDCNNKFHINICCNGIQNICDKSTVKSERESKTIKEPIKCGDVKIGYKAIDGTITKAMFKTASGKDLMLNKKLLSDAEGKFEDKEEIVCPKGVNTDKTGKSVKKASKLYHDNKSDSYQYKKTEKDVDLDANKKASQKANQIYGGALPNNLCGFKSASGKQIKVSENALQNARKMYHDSEELSSKDMNPECKADSLNDTIKNDEKRAKQKTRVLYTDVSSTQPDSKIDVPDGYTIISGKLVKKQNMEDAVPSKEEGTNNEIKLPVHDTNNVYCGFKSAAGKSVKISANAFRRAKRFLDENNSPAGDSSNQAILFSGFESASGTKIDISKTQLKKAKEVYAECNNTKLCMGDFEEKVMKTVNTHVTDKSQSVSDSTSKKAFELLEDVAETVDSALAKLKKDRLYRSANARRRLGISKCKQINISKEKVDKAKRLFSNESFNNSMRDISVVTTPKNSEVGCSSTPLRGTPQLKNVEFFKNAIESDITPIKTVSHDNRSDIYHTVNSSIIIRTKTPGTIDDWYATVLTQINSLKNTLKSLEDKKCNLEKQMSFVHYASKEHKKQRSGILYNKKISNSQRMPLKALEINDSSCNIEEGALNVTPRNADMIHFSFSSLGSDRTTQDGAIIIANPENLVGLSEIEMAFRTMIGVEPDLIPKGWIANHYRLIVWKLASYERFAPQQLRGSLSIENIIQQLKYRYDREIDRAERPALRRILEKDDVSQKRMVLCVSDVVKVANNNIELELTDGWYCIRTIIDDLLIREVNREKIKIGTKLLIYGAQLLNCDGCHPLQVTDLVKLKITYNCTRRAAWYAKLGYQKCPEPFAVPLSSVHPDGGMIGSLKLYIVRVYPIRYMEQTENRKVWRNKKAEEKYANIFENERLEKIENIHYSVQEKYERDMCSDMKTKNIEHSKLNEAEILNITCARTLYKLLEGANDPDSLMEILLPSQRVSILEYRQQLCLQREQEISRRISEEVEKLKLTKRKVTPVLKLLVLDNFSVSEETSQFCIWNPKEDDITILKENCSLTAYNVVPRSRGNLFSTSKTYFILENKQTTHTKFKRRLFPLSMTTDPFCKPVLNEFDTVGLVVKITINSNDQSLWVTDSTGTMLLVNVRDGPATCSLFDGISKGQVISLVNLVYCKPQKDFGKALANQFTIISTSPQQSYLRDEIEHFKMNLPQDSTQLLRDCEQNIEKYNDKIDIKQNTFSATFQLSNLGSSIYNSDVLDDSTLNSSRLTATDVAMSLIDTDKFT